MARLDTPSTIHDEGLGAEVAHEDAPGDVAAVVAGGSADDADRILSVAQVARRLGCSVSLVQKWRRLGWIPAIQFGPPDVPIYGYRTGAVDAFAVDRWNRRRGRPPKDPTAPVTPRRGTSPVVDEYAMGDPTDDALEEVARATRPAPAIPVADVPGARATIDPSPVSARSMARPDPATPSPAPARPVRPSRGRPPRPVIVGPLTIWAGDPRQRGALMLARLAPGPVEQAVAAAERYAQRYDDIVLSEAEGPGPRAADAAAIGRWERGKRTEG